MLNVAAQADPSSGKVNLTLGLITPLDGIFGFSRIAAATTIAVEDAVREGFLENFDIRLDKLCLSCTTTVCECVRLCVRCVRACVRSRVCVRAFVCACRYVCARVVIRISVFLWPDQRCDYLALFMIYYVSRPLD